MVLLEIDDSIAILTLNRPERHNSLIPAMLEELLTALNEIEATPEVRVTILQANGGSFSTGGDMQGFFEHLDDIANYSRHIVGLLNQAILSMLSLRTPVIAAVQGIVTGGSLGLVLASDIVLVTTEVSFTPYYSVVGFSPDGGWTAILPLIIGHKRTAEILVGNQTITANQAVSWGLANRLVPGRSLRSGALEIARGLASLKEGSQRYTKQLLNASYGDVAGRLESERTLFVEQITTDPARQGIMDFMGR